MLARGSRGSDVRALQQHLVAWGAVLRVDGVFGPRTEDAVRQLQAAEGLVVDGVVGPRTMAVLQHGPVETLQPAPRVPACDTAGERAVAFALQDLGKTEEPLGSNAGPHIGHLVDGYRDHWRLGSGVGLPWCAMAVSVWTARALELGDAGAEVDWVGHPFGAWFGGVEQIRAWAVREGRLEAGPSVGSILVMSREGAGSDARRSPLAGHCGLVVRAGALGLQSIEGNVTNRVVTRTRRIADVDGFVRWW